ncbi:hypothetical protein TNIN_78051 [Trichonephila inaurata madagascariensis]|uniref:Uncharacterized protein n=1 Tax=Trichonephila inaurata madagascariensis TaxID=2747483 RepID=A0A8X7C467_9ARAC|nr:hypothetical protein TNIN_78051 [Trichonephila inaurata madagascariensis]
MPFFSDKREASILSQTRQLSDPIWPIISPTLFLYPISSTPLSLLGKAGSFRDLASGVERGFISFDLIGRVFWLGTYAG